MLNITNENYYRQVEESWGYKHCPGLHEESQ